MSQEYQHACERAELFGLAVPSEGEWKDSESTQEGNFDNAADENAIPEDLDKADESAKKVGGGLSELNSILSSTQRKINRFKTVCGSLGTLLKIKGRGSQPATPTHVMKDNKNGENEGQSTSRSENSTPIAVKKMADDPVAQHKKIDVNEKLGSHLDKLDSLINSAEHAEYSMQHQTKQMRQIIK